MPSFSHTGGASGPVLFSGAGQCSGLLKQSVVLPESGAGTLSSPNAPDI